MVNFTINAKIVVTIARVGENRERHRLPGATAGRIRRRRTDPSTAAGASGAATKPISRVPDETADQVHADHVERVVKAEFEFQADGQRADHTADEADHQRAERR